MRACVRAGTHACMSLGLARSEQLQGLLPSVACNAGDIPLQAPGSHAVRAALCKPTEDVNECSARANPCGDNSICTNTVENYTCACAPGWSSPTEDGRDCTGARINEPSPGVHVGMLVHGCLASCQPCQRSSTMRRSQPKVPCTGRNVSRTAMHSICNGAQNQSPSETLEPA